MLFKNKKASLEISISAIVIVVLAMTLLGLGLGFIRNMFKDIGGISSDVTEQVRQKILDDLITGDKKISFPKTQIVIDKGGSDILTVGVRNKKDTPLEYQMEFKPRADDQGRPFSIDKWFLFGEGQKYTLASADSDVRNIRLSMPTNVNTGSYFLNFQVIDTRDTQNPIYDSKDFFITVRG
ncbi:hypothetical protein J4458_02935 [Candidatus Woesearchaeota archaeon]|nr:hypothetical protein [Candidatus Woesearchaeota archaeon]